MFKQTLTLRRAIVLVVVFGLLVPALLISGYSWFEIYDRDVQRRERVRCATVQHDRGVQRRKWELFAILKQFWQQQCGFWLRRPIQQHLGELPDCHRRRGATV